MKIKVYQVNAFIGAPNGGNPAGVVLNADALTPEQMQKIAYELGYSETAFVLKSSKADYRVRFFTVATEVPLCGHATLATRHLLQAKDIITKPEAKQETLAGCLSLKLEGETVVMEQALPKFSPILDKEMLMASLNLTEEDLVQNIPVEMVSTGFPTMVVPVKSLERLKSLQFDKEKGEIVCDKTNLVHVFTLEPVNSDSMAFSRVFFFCDTEEEDAATGTSTGALACYLFKHGLLKDKDLSNITFDQGIFMGRPSLLTVRLETQGETIQGVWVGGKCEVIKEFEIEVQ